MDKDEKGAEEVQETDSEKDTRGKTAKRKSVSQSQFDDLQSMLAGMQSEMSKLVSVLQDSVIPTKRLRSTEPNATTSQSEGLENQFLANSNERQCRMPSNENQFLLQQNGNQFATILSGDQLPAFQPSADILNEDLIPETSPLSLSTETIEGQFVPTCDNRELTISQRRRLRLSRREILIKCACAKGNYLPTYVAVRELTTHIGSIPHIQHYAAIS